MNKQQAEKVALDFNYLIGKELIYMEMSSRIIQLKVESDANNNWNVFIHADIIDNPKGNGWNELIQTYCKNLGIVYSFPE